MREGVSLVRAEEVDLSSLQFWLAPEEERDRAFAALRRHRPIAFFKEPEFGTAPPGPGFWALTRYDDVRAASRDPEAFVSGKGV
ncbi:MAG TPA: cytochrome P450, partial [Acidimicrobiales bacterium]|nr:cytochrome P450 [Acidimicrobiales bacterium]